MADICGDNRFEIIKKAKAELLKSTNIETSEDEMKVLDNFLFRCWQMGWLEGLVEEETKFSTASNPIEIKSNANCLTRERVDALVTKIDKELPSGSQNVWELPNGYQFTDENGNVINATKIVLEKKKKEYPKTIEECKYETVSGTGYKTASLLSRLDRLLACRAAYWKIAGEEMGLGKPWEPDWGDDGIKYTIEYYNEEIIKDLSLLENRILSFPTAEMRDAFYENFKEEIESVKELL